MNGTNNACNLNDPAVNTELSRELSLFHLTMMGAGMMIGAGVFVATGISIGVSGAGGIMVTFALNGLVALFSAMSYAELASALPAAGGAYTYVQEAFGGVLGFLSGWMNWFALAVAGSLYAITFSTYTIHLLKSFAAFGFLEAHLGLYEKLLALAVAVFFIAVNYRGVSETGNSATLIALGQTVTLGIIGIIGVFVALKQPERLVNFSPFLTRGWGKILVTMGFTYVGFEGYEVIGHAGEEAINPKENIPKAILYAVLIVVTTYMLVAFAAVVGAKPGGMALWEWFSLRGATGFADAIKSLFPFGGILVTLAAIFSSTSALNATIYSAARVSFAMGRDGALPKRLARISEKKRVPDVALFCSSVILLVVVALLPVEDIAASADIMFLLIFLMINVAVIKIRRERGDELDYGFLMPFFPFVPIFALVLQLLLAFWLLDMSVIAWGATLVWIGVGGAIYLGYASKQTAPEARPLILAEARDPIESGYHVMVPINNPENARTLTRYAEEICAAKGGELVLTNIVTVPDQIPLKEAKAFVCEKQQLIEKIRLSVREDLPIHSIIRYSHDAARGIVSLVKERNSNLLVLGWKGYSRWSAFSMGSKLDRIIERAPSDILVVKPGKTETGSGISRILFPTNGGFHSIMASGIVEILAKANGAQITVLNVNRDGKESADRIRRRLELVLKQFGDLEAELKIASGEDIADAVVAEAASGAYDLMVLGATEEGWFQQLLFGTLPERIAARCDMTVLLAKRDLGLRSWFKRWFGKPVE